MDKCVMCDGEYPIHSVFWLFLFVAKKKKTRRVSKVSHVLYYSSWCDFIL